MKAAFFGRIGRHPFIEEFADPIAVSGDVVVDGVTATVLSYAGEVLSGKRPLIFDQPFLPGVARSCA